MTQLTDDLISFEVPEGAAGFEIDNPLSPGDLVYYLGFPSVFNFRKVSLPPGSWQFICTTKEATEQQAAGIVEHEELFINGKSQGILYCNYHCSHDVCEWYKYPRDSLNSLLTSKGLDGRKNYALLKKG